MAYCYVGVFSLGVGGGIILGVGGGITVLANNFLSIASYMRAFALSSYFSWRIRSLSASSNAAAFATAANFSSLTRSSSKILSLSSSFSYKIRFFSSSIAFLAASLAAPFALILAIP